VRRSLEGAVLAGVALLYFLEARSFRTGFIADPIGPRAFPFGIGALAFLAGAAIFFSKRASAEERLEAPALLRMVVLTASLLGYALLLEPLGFVLSTTIAAAVLVILFRGRPLEAVAFGLFLGLSIYFLFVYPLSLPLPFGRLFERT
jgi:putative tricarboxylic transport membrane protein